MTERSELLKFLANDLKIQSDIVAAKLKADPRLDVAGEYAKIDESLNRLPEMRRNLRNALHPPEETPTPKPIIVKREVIKFNKDGQIVDQSFDRRGDLTQRKRLLGKFLHLTTKFMKAGVVLGVLGIGGLCIVKGCTAINDGLTKYVDSIPTPKWMKNTVSSQNFPTPANINETILNDPTTVVTPVQPDCHPIQLGDTAFSEITNLTNGDPSLISDITLFDEGRNPILTAQSMEDVLNNPAWGNIQPGQCMQVDMK